MGKKIALVVGNNSYPDPYRELERGGEGASEVAGFLKQRPGFETTSLYNRTAAEVTTKLLELARRLKDASQFFFYFAGRSLMVGNAESRSLLRTDATASLLQNVPGACELKREAEAATASSCVCQWSDSLIREAGTRQTLKVGDAEYGFCWIPAGEFDMGSPKSENGRDDDETLHHVKLTRGFWMLETPVTQSLYVEVMKENPSRFKGENLPVEEVSWDEAMDFCAKLTKRLPSGLTASLPTESQWEYACRAGTKTAYWYGDSIDQSKMNCGRLFLGETSPVKSYAPNRWGLYDMHGNVCEWVLDYYEAYPTGTVVDPKGPDSALNRVIRGGSWYLIAGDCRSAVRYGDTSDSRYFHLGFRVLLSCD